METMAKVAVNVFVIKKDEVLLGKRKTSGNGYWGLPGGHLEFGESPLEGAMRELEEETGIKADNLIYKHTVNTFLPEENKHYISVNFVLENPDREPKLIEPDKFYEWKWFNLDQLPEKIFIGHKKIIKNFNSKTSYIN